MINRQRVITIALVTVMAMICFVAIPVMASTVSLVTVDSSGFADLFVKLGVEGGVGGFSVLENKTVSEPATMLLLGIGLIGLAGVSRRKVNM